MSTTAMSPRQMVPGQVPCLLFCALGGELRPAGELQRLPGWHGYTGCAEGAEALESWDRQRPPASTA